MIDMIDLRLKNKTMLLSNLSFDHPLLDGEINDLITMLSSQIFIGQIYFKDDIDIASIEKVKLLLEGLPNIDDSKIEKYIIKSIDKDEKEQLISMNFLNIDTWNVAYSIEENKYSITSLSKYRVMNEWFSNTIREMDMNSFVLDKVCYLYDKVKLFEYDKDGKYSRLPEIISSGKANSYGFNLIYSQLLSLTGIFSEVFTYESNDGVSYITVATIDDKDQEISGIYIFDPSLDTISRTQYKNPLARRMNYNFFAITMDKLKTLKGGVKPLGLLKVLMSKDELEYRHNLNRHVKKSYDNETKDDELLSGMKLVELYSMIKETSSIDENIVEKCLTKWVKDVSKDDDDKSFLESTIMSNYIARDCELFNMENVKSMSKNDKLKLVS